MVALLLDRGPSLFFDPRRGNAPDHVIVYTTSWCPVCERLRHCLRRHAIKFEERDVERSARAALEWYGLDAVGVPVTVVGQQVAYGMRRGELETALGGAGFRVDCWGPDALVDVRESTGLRSAHR